MAPIVKLRKRKGYHTRACAAAATAEPWRGMARRPCRVENRRDVSFIADIFHFCIPFPYKHNTSVLTLSSCSPSSPSRTSAHRDRKNRPPKPDVLHQDTYSDVQAIRFLESVFHDFSLSLPRIGEIDYFLADIGEIDFLAVTRSTTSWDSRIVFFLVDVRGTALRTSSCIDCGRLLQATHYVD